MATHPQLSYPLALLFLGVSTFGGCGSERNSPKDTASSAASVEDSQVDPLPRARRMLQIGDYESAAEAAYEALVQDPERDDAKLITSQIEAARGNHQVAIDLASSIDMRSRLGPRAIEVHFQELSKMNRPSEAADVLLEAIELAPEGDSRALDWHRKAWSLLSRVGRRQEASRQVDALCRAGVANQGELLSIARRNDSFPLTLPPGIEPEDLFEPGLGMARWHFTNHDFDQALEELSSPAASSLDSPEVDALYGRLLAETQTLERIPAWHAKCNPKAREFSDYWMALGTYFFDRNQHEAAAGAFLKASIIDHSDNSCAHRLARVFEALGESEKGEQFRHRAALIYQIEYVAKESPAPGEASQSDGVPPLLIELGRPFEAIGWTLLTLPPGDTRRRSAILAKLSELKQNQNAIEMASQMSLVGVDPDRFSLQSGLDLLKQPSPENAPSSLTTKTTKQLAAPSLVNVAAEVGLEFQWHQDIESNLTLIPLHELMGGGIAILDYDLNGWPDVYLAQGAGEPPTDACVLSNALFRNVGGSFSSIAGLAGAEDFNYSSGLAAGDVNQDGFADLLIGSLGRNRLLINNGDGTFRDATSQWGAIADRFTSSVAVADISGDAIPDLYEAVYVEMAGGFDPPEIAEDGSPLQPSPVMHYAQSDRWFENQRNGTFQPREISLDVADPGTSLGLVVTDFNNDGTNEIFIGNDARSNHFLVQYGDNQFRNTAGVKGISSGFSGEAEACMGIATGDFDRNGTIDLHISNYSKESANHYLQTAAGAFNDHAVRYGIEKFTRSLIGFGVKAADVDRNGWLDLMVSNGHVFDLRIDGEEFQMPPQFLSNLGDRFELTPVEDTSGYWDGKYLGRTVTMTDFDRDGAIDFLVGHLHHPLALLHNQTRTSGHWIQFELIGTTSERDAIGARVALTMTGGEKMTQWVTAGDGYLCSDEAVIDFGLGDPVNLAQVEVTWPSGVVQIFDNVTSDRRYLIVEGDVALHER
ncbi:MAG: FG-GAP-like repeat-containing protein [Rubripirellula sp.]